MKRFVLILTLFHICIFANSQEFFSKLTTPSQFATSYALNALNFQNDTLCIHSYLLKEVKSSFFSDTYLTRYDRQGDLIDAVRLGVESKRSKILIDGGRILSVGRFKIVPEDTLQIVLVEGNNVTEKMELWNPYSYQGLGAHFQFIEYNNQYLLFCSGSYSLQTKDQEHFPYIYWINKDFTLDSLMRLDFEYGQLFDYGIDDDGYLNIVLNYHSDRDKSGPNNTINYQGYIKVNKEKKIIHKYFEEEHGIVKYRFSKEPCAAFFADGKKVITGTNADKVLTSTIYALDKNDKMIWSDTTYYDQQQQHVSFAVCGNGDVLVTGHNSHLTFLDSANVPLHSSYIQRIDELGKEKFYRSYGYFDNLGRSDGNWLYEIKEKSSNSIYAIGGVNTFDEHAVYGKKIKNDSTWILHVDSLGCIDKDMCNDIYTWNAPNGLYKYDQINMRHKEWYFSKDGRSYIQYFGQDTVIYDRTHKWIRYRPIISRDIEIGIEKKDTVYTAWFGTGKLYISSVKKCFECSGSIYLLYDFNVEINDIFTLPYDFGFAKVLNVDTIELIPGYLRKRITLRHLNPANQSKYGDLIWIEGVGSPNGILYYHDWEQGTKTELTCYYDRGEKRYSGTNDPDCRKPALIKPEFAAFGPYCIESDPDLLPLVSQNEPGISGTWSPPVINTSVSGSFRYVFTPDGGQYADTTTLLIQISDKITPQFNIKTNYSLNEVPDDLLSKSVNGIEGSWSPEVIDTKTIGRFSYVFTPEESYCATSFNIDINVSKLTDTTEMHRSAIWYSSSYIGDFSSGDCRLKIDITKVVRDTTIHDRICRVIGVFTNGVYLPESEIITFQKEGKIFFYEDDTWKLLYDFKAEVGDTVTYSISVKYPFYFKYFIIGNVDQEIIANNPYKLLIEKIDTVYTTNGKPLRRFYTRNLEELKRNVMDTIIENVGSVLKLFGNSTIIVPPECAKDYPTLRCYIDDDVYIKFTEGACDMVTFTQDYLNSQMGIYPNPGHDKIQILLDKKITLPVNCEISDISGRILLSSVQFDKEFELYTHLYSKGIYIITIRDYNGVKSVGKWVKQ